MNTPAEDLKLWLDDHIDDYVELPNNDQFASSYSVDTNKMAEDIIKFLAPLK